MTENYTESSLDLSHQVGGGEAFIEAIKAVNIDLVKQKLLNTHGWDRHINDPNERSYYKEGIKQSIFSPATALKPALLFAINTGSIDMVNTLLNTSKRYTTDLNIYQDIIYFKSIDEFFELSGKDERTSENEIKGIITPIIYTLHNAYYAYKIPDPLSFNNYIDIANFLMEERKYTKKEDISKVNVNPNIYGNIIELMPLNLIYKVLNLSSETKGNPDIRKLFYRIYQRTDNNNKIKLNKIPEFYKTTLSFVEDQNYNLMFPTSIVKDKNEQIKTLILFLAEISKELNYGNQKNLLSYKYLKCEIFNLMSSIKLKDCSKKNL